MLPTMPRARERSLWTSWSMPFSTRATRVSMGVMLISSSSPMAPASGHTMAAQQLGGLVEGQADDGAVTALDALHEHRRQPLDAIAAGLVRRLTAGPVALYLAGLEGPQPDPGTAQGLGGPVVIHHTDGGEHLVVAPAEAPQHGQAVLPVPGLAQNDPVLHHDGVGPQHGPGPSQGGQPGPGLVLGHAPDIGLCRLAWPRALVDVGVHPLEVHPDLAQQFAAPRRAGSQVQAAHPSTRWRRRRLRSKTMSQGHSRALTTEGSRNHMPDTGLPIRVLIQLYSSW